MSISQKTLGRVAGVCALVATACASGKMKESGQNPALTDVAPSAEAPAGEATQSLRTLGGVPSTTEVWLEDYCGGSCPAYGPSGDWATVIQAALASPECAPYSPTDPNLKRRSCTLRTAGPEIRTTQSIHVCRPTRFVGSGRGAGTGNTMLTLANGASIYFHFDGSPYDLPATKCPWNVGQHVTSGGAELSNLQVRRDPASPKTGTWTAIEAHSSIVLNSITVTDFDAGVLIHGDVLGGYGNANGWRANGVNVSLMAGRGWEVRGQDANAGNANALVIANVCQTAGTWQESAPDMCTGLRDTSLIGNQYSGVSVQYVYDTALGATNPAGQHPPYWLASPTSIDYAYEETNSRGSYFDDNPLIDGGNITAGKRCTGTNPAPCSTNSFCVSLNGSGNVCSNLGFRAAVRKGSYLDGTHKAVNLAGGELIMGDYDANTAWGAEVATLGSGTNVRFTYDSTAGSWCLRAGGTGKGGACVTTTNSVSLGAAPVAGASWLGKQNTGGGAGDWVEGTAGSIVERLSGAAPDPNAVSGLTCKIAGSTYYNTRPAVGETLVWLCRCSNGADPTAAGACASGFTWVPLQAVP